MNTAEFDQERIRKFAKTWIGARGRGGQAELARLLGVSEPTVSRFLSGATELHKASLKKLAGILNIGRPVDIRDPFINLSERLHSIANLLVNDAWSRSYRTEQLIREIEDIYNSRAEMAQILASYSEDRSE